MPQSQTPCMQASLVAVCTSERTGEKKIPVPSVRLIAGYGIEGDVHGGTGRQVSLLAVESVEPMREKMPSIADGSFAENLLVRGLAVAALPLGTRLAVGDDGVELEITQIGKTCHAKCAIHTTVGYCIMPKEGVFARVLHGGVLRPGDTVRVLD